MERVLDRIRRALVTVVAVVLATSPLWLAPQPVLGADAIRIGAVFSVGGWAGFIGTPEKDAVVAIVEDINANGGLLGKKIELLVEDDQSSPTNAVIAATKLIKDHGITIIVGPTLTDSGMAMIPLCEQEKVPLVVTSPLVTPLKKWAFLIGPGDVRGANYILEYAVNVLGAKKVALMHDTANYGMTGAKIVNKEISKYPGAAVVIQEKFEPGDTNMVPQLTKIKAANPDVLILYGTGSPAAVVAKNYKQLGMTTRVLGSTGTPVGEFAKIAGPIAEESRWILMGNKTAVASKLAPGDPYRKDLYDPFNKLLKAKYKDLREANIFHTLAYDGIKVAIEAIKAAGTTDRAAVRDGLEKIRFRGFLGDFACSAKDHQGSPSAKDTIIPLVVKNGEYWPYQDSRK
jgi:branched-chain amino acid transport system substrate-binding protein